MLDFFHLAKVFAETNSEPGLTLKHMLDQY